ncbi:cellobiohydrolase. Glycosyl Hydrolase family 6 [Thermobifida fusca YX]|uniref:Glucanase n=2 Tax=Thermobifida fusca TaxID=2021 RepID=Q47SA9_THEFY|nr:beta-1,4-exocellulase precursor [Thermobifida fusca YX]AAZ54658.1 cellobiohydrolase. Glycosyl Hydrolase family 6 [Thermobifida fusca YX]prf//2109217A exocellulase E3 [Thermobifida fusca]
MSKVRATNRRSWMRRGLAAASGLALGASMVAFAAPANAAGCSVDYTVNSWGTGFTANVTITNLGSAINGWTLEWDFPGNQQVTNLWNGTYTQSGQHVSVSNAPYNASIPANGTVEFGFNGSYSGSNDIPSSFKLNGVTCDGSDDPDPEPSPSPSPSPSPTDPDEPGGPTNPPTNPGEKVDNPFEGAKLYVNPVWSAKAAAEPGGSAVANESTAVWLDRIGAIEGNDSPTTGSMGLRDHLEEAVRQSGGDPLTIQVVIYNLPGRDCAALASNGELGPDELDRYKSEYIDPIADIMWDFADYENLRIVAIIEIDSLPNLVTNVGGNGGTELCAYMKQNGGYVNGVGYALRKLGEIPNVYNYIDAAHHGWIGWDSNFGPSVDIFYEAANASGSTVDYVHGFISNTANYSATVEPYLDVNGTVNGQLIRQSKWVDWNQYVDELSFVQDLRQALIAKGFRSDIGMLIDTSRNGWGGPNRPTGPSSSTDLNTYVDESRIDRRIHPGNWCNQAGAGLGERPTVNPAPGVDAYVWVKPPGESDGASEEIPNDEGKGFDRMCDPTYQGNARNGNNPSGALPNAPISGHWFSAQFRELLANAYPPL